MCLGIPAKVIEINGYMAVVEVGSTRREVSLQLVPDAKVEDYVLIHIGYAIQKINEKEAEETLELLKQLGESNAEGVKD